jgi:hypothetical protein
MKVTVKIFKKPDDVNIIFMLHNQHQEVIEHRHSLMFPGLKIYNYYQDLVDKKVIENNKVYEINNEFLQKLQDVKKVCTYDNIFITHKNLNGRHNNFELVENVNIHTILSTNCILHDKTKNIKYNCGFINQRNSAAKDFCEGLPIDCHLIVSNITPIYVDFFEIGNNIYSYYFLRKTIPYCVEINHITNTCYFIDRDYVYISLNINIYYTGKNVTRYFIYDDASSPWKDHNFLAQALDKIYNLCNNKKIINENRFLRFIRKNIYEYFQKKINIPLPTLEKPLLSTDLESTFDNYTQIRYFSEKELEEFNLTLPDTVYYISFKEELMQKVYHPQRLVYYMSKYNYCINEEKFIS